MDVDVVFLEKAWDEVPGPALLGHKTLDDLRRFRAATKLPLCSRACSAPMTRGSLEKSALTASS